MARLGIAIVLLLFLCLATICRPSQSAQYYPAEVEEDDGASPLSSSASSEQDGRDQANTVGEDEDGEEDGRSFSHSFVQSRPLSPSRHRRLFKTHGQLGGTPNETWPPGFYRLMSICVHPIFRWKVIKQEGANGCPTPNGTIAVGRYRVAQNETGWGILEVETFDNFEPEVQAYAAGLVEGALTRTHIFYHFKNTVGGLCNNAADYCKKLYNYLEENLRWIETQVKTRPASDLYWRQVNLTFIQLTGINDAYTIEKSAGYVPRVQFANTPVFRLQLSGELFDLDHLFKNKKRREMDGWNESSEEGEDNGEGDAEDDDDPGHCSGFVRVTDGNKDLLMSQVAMAGYNTMNRMVKLYKFAYDRKAVPGYAVSFSGYAGVLASVDDFTLTSAGLLSIETTIAVFNESLYQLYVKSEGQLHCWVRSYISNQLAATAHDWVKIFARYNSGTYNNQWTVVDYKLFKPGQSLPSADLVWILEQIPGTCVSRDVTWFLAKYGYWPSYNIPYLAKISELSGFGWKGNVNNWWRWGYSPRARIFQRDQAKANDIDSLQTLMRYNDYKNDPFSRCNCTPPYTAEAGISARGDLNPPDGKWEVPGMGFRNHGSLDFKGTNYELFKQMRFQLIGGPTYGGHGNLPYFSWANTNVVAPHMGQPTNWNFKPFVTLWQTQVSQDMMTGQ